jgi:hypothetical protein
MLRLALQSERGMLRLALQSERGLRGCHRKVVRNSMWSLGLWVLGLGLGLRVSGSGWCEEWRLSPHACMKCSCEICQHNRSRFASISNLSARSADFPINQEPPEHIANTSATCIREDARATSNTSLKPQGCGSHRSFLRNACANRCA